MDAGVAARSCRDLSPENKFMRRQRRFALLTAIYLPIGSVIFRMTGDVRWLAGRNAVHGLAGSRDI
jgi:hypothetical protein